MSNEKKIHTALLDVLTALPGKIVNYSGGRATVQPTLGKRLANGDALPAPQIFDVPVIFPSGMGGKAKLSVPLAADDPVFLIFSSRGLDEWKENGDATPETLRAFDLTDAFAIPFGGHVSEYDKDNVYLGFGESSIKITPGGEIVISAKRLRIESPETALNGALTAEGDVNAGDGKVSMLNHTHTAPHGETSTGHG